MPLDLTRAMTQLSQFRVAEFHLRRVVPDFVVPVASSLVDAVVAGSVSAESLDDAQISPEAAWALGWFARMLAGRAVRRRSIADVRDGMVALALACAQIDLRDAFSPLSLLDDAARRLGEDPSTVLGQISGVIPASATRSFATFFERPESARSISVFGFAAGSGPDGFDYVSASPEGGR